MWEIIEITISARVITLISIGILLIISLIDTVFYFGRDTVFFISKLFTKKNMAKKEVVRSIRISKELEKEIANQCEKEYRTFNNLVEVAIKKYLENKSE